jgi:hypothetical protein
MTHFIFLLFKFDEPRVIRDETKAGEENFKWITSKASSWNWAISSKSSSDGGRSDLGKSCSHSIHNKGCEDHSSFLKPEQNLKVQVGNRDLSGCLKVSEFFGVNLFRLSMASTSLLLERAVASAVGSAAEGLLL